MTKSIKGDNDNFSVDEIFVFDALSNAIGFKHALLLNSLGYEKVVDLAKITEASLKLLPGMGPVKIMKLKEALATYGVSIPNPPKPNLARITMTFSPN